MTDCQRQWAFSIVSHGVTHNTRPPRHTTPRRPLAPGRHAVPIFTVRVEPGCKLRDPDGAPLALDWDTDYCITDYRVTDFTLAAAPECKVHDHLAPATSSDSPKRPASAVNSLGMLWGSRQLTRQKQSLNGASRNDLPRRCPSGRGGYTLDTGASVRVQSPWPCQKSPHAGTIPPGRGRTSNT